MAVLTTIDDDTMSFLCANNILATIPLEIRACYDLRRHLTELSIAHKPRDMGRWTLTVMVYWCIDTGNLGRYRVKCVCV